MRERLLRTAKKYLIILLVGIAYLVWVLLTDLGLPCPLYKLTGIQCPGCGISRMFVALARFDISAAFSYNQFVFVAGPIILCCMTYSEFRYIKYGKPLEGRLATVGACVLFVAAIAFSIWRNLC